MSYARCLMSGLLSSRLADTQASSLSQVPTHSKLTPWCPEALIYTKPPFLNIQKLQKYGFRSFDSNVYMYLDVDPKEQQLDAIMSTAVETSSLGLITGCIKQWTAEGEESYLCNGPIVSSFAHQNIFTQCFSRWLLLTHRRSIVIPPHAYHSVPPEQNNRALH